jgi:exodeoxyribonuclease V alpha subunit
VNNESLQQLRDNAVMAPIDWQFAHYIGRIDSSSEVILAAGMLSQALGQQHSCVSLQQRCDAGEAIPGSGIASPSLQQWLLVLHNSTVVTEPGGSAPLVLDNGLLYLARYHHYEGQVATAIAQRSVLEAIDEQWLALRLQHYFAAQDKLFDGQKLAAAIALTRRFSLIAGGPGTGKTTTVVKILALLREWGNRAGEKCRICMAAPTGKAAARLAQAIRHALQHDLCIDRQLASSIPCDVTTVHRLLRPLPNSSRFRHTADNPLPCDVLLVDEVSMLDVGLMAQLMTALPPRARVILLGDRDQLPSVGVGRVLQDLCAGLEQEDADGELRYSRQQRDLLQRLCGFELPPAKPGDGMDINDGIALLQRSYRFAADSGIGELASIVKAGNVEAARVLLQRVAAGAVDDVVLMHPESTSRAWLELLAEPYLPLFRQWLDPAISEQQKLQQLDEYRILCALREGTTGVAQLNQYIESYLVRQGLAPSLQLCYPGKPIMIAENSHSIQLYNGDTGVILSDDRGQLYACFESGEGTVRRLPLSRLPRWESSYAISVHKSQGSEYRHAALVLPLVDAGGGLSPLLTRELIYTAVTRARERLTLACSGEAFRGGLRRRVQRDSGLAERLQRLLPAQ